MRKDYQAFTDIGAQIVVITQHEADKMREYWKKEKLPFVGIADPEEVIANIYHQQWKLIKLGRMPAQFVVNCAGMIVFAHYGSSMSDIPANKKMLKIIRGLSTCEE